MSMYYAIVENTHQVLQVGEFDSLIDARNSEDLEHFTHGENCILVPSERLEDVFAALFEVSEKK